MKVFSVFSMAVVALLIGCATHEHAATSSGLGTKRVYVATFDQAWRAAVDAARQNDLQVVNADRAHGCIAARRISPRHRSGENLDMWVRQTSPAATEVEVLSRDMLFA